MISSTGRIIKYFSIITILIIVINTITSCSVNQPNYIETDLISTKYTQVKLFDNFRNREIPIAIYFNKSDIYLNKLVLVNHGYGFNAPDSYVQYNYLCDTLSQLGFDVVSIQHELPQDSLLPLKGDPKTERMPFWIRGAENIHFVLDYLESELQEEFYNEVILIGHSNGGDMCVLFPQMYPGEANKIVSLDHRRMPIQPDSSMLYLSLRSNDQQADSGVIPEPEVLREFNIQIKKLDAVGHNDMDDTGNHLQKEEIVKNLLPFILED